MIGGSQRGLALLAQTLDPKAAADAAGRHTPRHDHGPSSASAPRASSHTTSQQKLLRVGVSASYAMDTDLQVTAASMLRPSDAAFVVSYSGEHAAMREAARQAKGRGATVISLTMDCPNAVRSLAGINLLVPASERIYRQGAGTSRINQLAVVDVIYSIIVSRNLDSSIAAIERTMRATHPGEGASKG